MKHALLYGRESEVERNTLWAWLIDGLPLNISVELHLLDDEEFIAVLFGDTRGLINLCDEDKFFLKTAKYNSYIKVISLINSFLPL